MTARQYSIILIVPNSIYLAVFKKYLAAFNNIWRYLTLLLGRLEAYSVLESMQGISQQSESGGGGGAKPQIVLKVGEARMESSWQV